MIVRNCVVSDAADGIRLEGSDDVLIFNNLLYGNGNRGVRIGSTRKRAADQQHHHRQRQSRRLHRRADADKIAPTDATLLNNLIQDNDSLAIAVDEGHPAPWSDTRATSIWSSPPAADQSKAYRPASIVGADDANLDAQFVDAGGGI
ncbi:MAG: right-handed parallel beta-helix repeat-containing protein [Candidatus Binatia bacterium]